jgi:hypothetical protein
MSVTAGDVMDRAAALLSDASKITMTYVYQLPFLKLAWDELQEELIANDIVDIEESVSSAITVNAGTKELTSGVPTDFVVPIKLWERAVGETDVDLIPMTKREPDPTEAQVAELEVWYFAEGLIKFRGATSNRVIVIRYQKELAAISNENTILPIQNVKSFLAYRTAGIIAETRQNKDRAAKLHDRAEYFLRKTLGTKVKDEQSEPVRPHRYGYGRRG